VLLTTFGIIVEGLSALRERRPPNANLMLVVASAALIVNGTSAWLLHDALTQSKPTGQHRHAPVAAGFGPDDGGQPAQMPHAGHSLNLRGAWLHAAGDALGALAALAAALVVRFSGSTVADPIGAFAVAAILIVGVLRLLRDSGLVFLEAAPAHLPVPAIRDLVLAYPGVTAVHELHVWALGAGHDAITVHVGTRETDLSLGRAIAQSLRKKLGVEYVTVQVEPTGHACSSGELEGGR
jgi:cobalt-zinc-cadmium efflux system protein